ncbi:MAG: hypothetical protein M3R46_05350 [Actinomycetota bacterium]|nr:hypothetical protein [Actinomycetota bacterium]
MFGGVALLLGAITSDVGGDLGGPNPAWFGLAAIGGTALFLGVAFALWRKANPRRDKSLEVRVDRHRARRGEELRVTVAGAPARAGIEVTLACRVHWDQRQRSGGGDGSSSTSRGGKHRLLQVAIRLCEHSRDYHEDVVYASAILVREGELAEADTFPFTLAVPPQAGPPITTEWGGLAWEVRAGRREVEGGPGGPPAAAAGLSPLG